MNNDEIEGRTNTINEYEFFLMPKRCTDCRAQIPLTKIRYMYLLGLNEINQKSDKWILYHCPGHFYIYDKVSKFCIFEAKYKVFNTNADAMHQAPDDEIVAVVTNIVINCDEEQYKPKDKGDFEEFADLICDGL